jgi:hypothetical protein
MRATGADSDSDATGESLPGLGAATKCSINLRVMTGASRASRECTARTAWMRSSGATFFRRKPLAPAWNAS